MTESRACVTNWLIALIAIASIGVFSAATHAEDAVNKGIGPVKEVKLDKLDPKMADKGKKIFDSKCASCHKMEERYVGPALKGITQRRTPEWTMNMILNPVEMTQKDPVAQELFGEYLTQMTFQNVTQDDVRAIYEYFRQVDSGGATAAAPADAAKKAADAPKKKNK